MTRAYLLPYNNIDGGDDSTVIAVMAPASSPTRVAGGSATLHGYVSITASKSLSEILSFSSAFFFSFAPVSGQKFNQFKDVCLVNECLKR